MSWYPIELEPKHIKEELRCCYEQQQTIENQIAELELIKTLDPEHVHKEILARIEACMKEFGFTYEVEYSYANNRYEVPIKEQEVLSRAFHSYLVKHKIDGLINYSFYWLPNTFE